MRPMTSSASMTTPRFVSAVTARDLLGRLLRGSSGRLTTNNADLPRGRLLFVVREVHRAIRRQSGASAILFVSVV